MKRVIRYFIIIAFCLAIAWIGVGNSLVTWEEVSLIVIGILLLYCVIRFGNKQRILHSSLKRIDKMSGVEFEVYLMYQFKKKRYKVRMTPESGDFGADLLLRKFMRQYIVQAKRYSGSVGIQAVQETIGAMRYYDIDLGIVVTNSYFTKAAKELANVSDIELWDRNRMVEEFRIRK